jgi:hypothetical protein
MLESISDEDDRSGEDTRLAHVSSARAFLS